jgi:hypothetical protein
MIWVPGQATCTVEAGRWTIIGSPLSNADLGPETMEFLFKERGTRAPPIVCIVIGLSTGTQGGLLQVAFGPTFEVAKQCWQPVRSLVEGRPYLVPPCYARVSWTMMNTISLVEFILVPAPKCCPPVELACSWPPAPPRLPTSRPGCPQAKSGCSWPLPPCCVQGDIGFAQVLQQMGASVEMTPHSVTVTGGPPDPATGRRLRGIDIDMNAMPDVAMTLAVLGLFADGPVAIRNGEPHTEREREAGKVAHEEKSTERSLGGLEEGGRPAQGHVGGQAKGTVACTLLG